MKFSCNVSGSERQRLVRAVVRATGMQKKYLGTPTMAYEVGPFTVSAAGVVECADDTDLMLIKAVYDAAVEDGFIPDEVVYFGELEEGDETSREVDADADGTGSEGLTISFPMEGLDQAAIERLRKLVANKGDLIKKAVGAATLDIKVEDGKVSFSWWSSRPEMEEIQAYMVFVASLCAHAKSARRVNAKRDPASVENEKYEFRCFLLRLGLIGAEHRETRQVLLRRLSGNTAFRRQEDLESHLERAKGKRRVE